MKEHDLKTWPRYFAPVRRNEKTFEIRHDDRGFEVGDLLILREWCPERERYTGEVERRRVSYIMRGPSLGLAAGWVAMGLGEERGRRSRAKSKGGGAGER